MSTLTQYVDQHPGRISRSDCSRNIPSQTSVAVSMSDSPNPISVLVSVVKAMRVSRPDPQGTQHVDHEELAKILRTLQAKGVAGLAGEADRIERYRQHLESIDPDTLDRDSALAFWLNLYNVGALALAAETAAAGRPTVLRVPGAFSRPWAEVNDERLSLSDIEHGKIRRFGDPRIHGALVCGSASCPTLRYEPYDGDTLETQMEAQMRSFLAGGGAVVEGSTLLLSRIFLWYGPDFVKPHRMPSWLPVSKKALQHALAPWLDGEVTNLSVGFQSYDWGLACTIG